jgi:mRNA-degrading endonuclease HigB of HigAB toxin-antitoxin module
LVQHGRESGLDGSGSSASRLRLIKGNADRLVTQVKYGPLFLVFIRFVGTRAEYDRIDANRI